MMNYRFLVSARRRGSFAAIAGALALLGLALPAPAADKALPPPASRSVDFQKDIAPLFQAKCQRCHGEKKQESSFRLDDEASAKKGGDLGEAYVPGDSGKSPLVHYVAGTDENILMPPEGEGTKLTDEEVGLLRAWIDQGAKWPAVAGAKGLAKPKRKPPEEHWAFHRPVRAALPAVQRQDWPRTPIDHFVLARLEKTGLTPAAEADRALLIRRLSLDLIGLPPSVADVNAFVKDSSPDAYEKLVDRLLASPHYGERWALWWLDVARYADTNGYEIDRPRSIWPYRDWVIGALNADMPFSQFTLEQMAGDLLPNATLAQKIATGFHRNTYFNEEGGHDFEQFRWEGIVDRVHTTSTAFLGLTMACAQCHNHKYDPIEQREYYSFFAFLNNDDEPLAEVPKPDVEAAREAALAEITQIESTLESSYPPDEAEWQWTALRPEGEAGAVATKVVFDDDGFFVVTVDGAPIDDCHLLIQTELPQIDALRIEAVGDAHDPAATAGHGTRRATILSECEIHLPAERGKRASAATIRAARNEEGQTITARLTDNNPDTGWIADVSQTATQPAKLTFEFAKPIALKPSTSLELRLKKGPGDLPATQRLRVLAGTSQRVRRHPSLAEDEQRQQALSAGFEHWCKEAAADARAWTVLEPASWTTKNNSTVTKLEDSSLFVSGDRPEVELFEVHYRVPLARITGIQLEALPDARLPSHGPGRGYLSDDGSFFISEFSAAVQESDSDGAPVRALKLVNPSANLSADPQNLAKALDGDKLTGWHARGSDHRQIVVFETAEPVAIRKDGELVISCLHNHPHSQSLGRFRILVTSDAAPVVAKDWPLRIEQLLTHPADTWSSAERDELKRFYLSVAPELSSQQARIDKLRRGMPALPTTLVLEQRSDSRKTHQHIRGEFRRPGEVVTADVPHFLHPFPADAPRNRLGLARWIVDKDNPLIGRVIVNQIWQCYFGRGLVNTPEDFGTQGEPPSHPELIDWLACQFIDDGWSLKKLHRLIVMSAAYRQSSALDPARLEADPENILISRGPRFRVYAEIVRDIILETSGLLNHAIGGPSVFPAQPEGLFSQAFGGSTWPTSKGSDLYRRGLYTHRKRALFYPAFAAFDAPQQSACSMRRVRSNTPLQALTLLNDVVVVEASHTMARRIMREVPAGDEARLEYACQLCLSRLPSDAEKQTLLAYYTAQRRLFEEEQADAGQIAAVAAKFATRDVQETRDLAAWTLVSRVLLNLDETISKE